MSHLSSTVDKCNQNAETWPQLGRVITTTRRSIEASRTSGCEGDGCCSPDLRATSRIMSMFLCVVIEFERLLMYLFALLLGSSAGQSSHCMLPSAA